MPTVNRDVRPDARLSSTKCHIRAVSAMVARGVRKDGSKLKPPMGYPFYAKMTDGDLDAIVAYLRTVPAKE